MKKTVALTLGLALASASASAGSTTLNYTVENGGDSWTFGSQYIALLGFGPSATQSGVIDAQTILDDIASGGATVGGLYNGVGNLGGDLEPSADPMTYESTTFFGQQFEFLSGDNLPYSNGIEAFTGVDLTTDGFGQGRYVSVFFLVFDGSSDVVFNGGVGGTATVSANGNLGEFPGSIVIPSPSAAGLGLAGLGGLAGLRRRRSA